MKTAREIITQGPPEWEAFCDHSYYGMWCVREVGSRTFGEGFHVSSKAEADALVAALRSTREGKT